MRKLMKKVVVLGLTVAMALGAMSTVSAAEGKVWKYSFNDALTAETAAAGWVGAYSQVYDDAVGYGFDAANSWTAGIYTKQESTKVPGTMIGIDSTDTVTLDAIATAVSETKGDPEVIFYVKLPAGTYDVTVYAGGISQNETYDWNKIFINGEEVVRNYETDPWNSEPKSSKSTVLALEDVEWTKTITLDKETKVEIKASNPKVEGPIQYFGTEKASAGSRAYMNAVVIEEVVKTEAPVETPTETPAEKPAETPSVDKDVPKTGVVSTAAICGVVALASAGVAVITRKKED